MGYYSASETQHLMTIALWIGVGLGVVFGALFAYLILDAIRAYRTRQVQRIEDDTRDAKTRVMGIANGAQADMIRLLMNGQSRRDDK